MMVSVLVPLSHLTMEESRGGGAPNQAGVGWEVNQVLRAEGLEDGLEDGELKAFLVDRVEALEELGEMDDEALEVGEWGSWTWTEGLLFVSSLFVVVVMTVMMM